MTFGNMHGCLLFAAFFSLVAIGKIVQVGMTSVTAIATGTTQGPTRVNSKIFQVCGTMTLFRASKLGQDPCLDATKGDIVSHGYSRDASARGPWSSHFREACLALKGDPWL